LDLLAKILARRLENKAIAAERYRSYSTGATPSSIIIA
jgi:hypothetical protein